VTIRVLEKTDIAVIVNGFKNSGGQIKSANMFEKYLDEQRQDKRICLVTFDGKEFSGYVSLKWQSDDKNLADDSIPGISDLNVLPSFRDKGIGSALIEKCEEHAANSQISLAFTWITDLPKGFILSVITCLMDMVLLTTMNM
jgi:ribosomal protein S18 acetylase RimI-like enzyme